MTIVRLTPAASSQCGVLQNLIQLYTHDFSGLWAGTTKGDVNGEGRFEDYPLGAYWVEEGYQPFLIDVDGAIGGFCLINNVSKSGRHVDANVAEFFVLRKYRGAGIGLASAHEVFGRRSGIWEIAVARKNAAAFRFWQRAVDAFSDAKDAMALDIATPEWDGPILRFSV